MQQIDSVLRELQNVINLLPRDRKYYSLRDVQNIIKLFNHLGIQGFRSSIGGC